MKIQVTGTGDILHGIGEDENKNPITLRIPPGVHVTSDEDPESMITPQLAKFLVANTNGHVIEYIPPDPKTTRVEQVYAQASPAQKEQKGLDEAQAAQKKRYEKSQAAQKAEGTVKK